MSLQEALKMLRLELGLSQGDLAKKINRAFVTVNRWENGKGFPSRRNAKDILEMAENCGASTECISYLRDMLLIDKKRERSARVFGFPDIDREFLFQLADGSRNTLYVIDALNYKLLYANRKAEQMSIEYLRRNGQSTDTHSLADERDRRCFHFFAGRETPCGFCPLRKINLERNQDTILSIRLYDRTYNAHIKCTEMKGRKIFVIYLMDTTQIDSEREALYRLTNDIPQSVGIYQVHVTGKIELSFMNEKLYKLIGEARKEQLLKTGETDLCLIHPCDRHILLEEIKLSIAEKRDISVDIHMAVAPSVYHLLHLDAKMIKKENDKITYYCVFHDLDEEKKGGKQA